MLKQLVLAVSCGVLFSGCSNMGNFGINSSGTSAAALSWKEAESNEFIPTNQKAATALIASAGNSLDITDCP